VIADYRCQVAEAPLWHEDLGALFWFDLFAGTLYRFDATGQHRLASEHGRIGGFTLQADGRLLLFGAHGRIWTWDPATGQTTTVLAAIPEERGAFNDVLADLEGRVFCGTVAVGDRPGHLWRLDPDGTLTIVLADAGWSNGMGFTPARDGLYHTDSRRRTITRYPYDRPTGALGVGEPIVAVPVDEGVPDGLAVDRDGTLWSARWNGGALVHYAPTGEPLSSVPFPAKKVASVTFGGADWREVYVTCAGGENKTHE
jgi:D-xylonolactonase